MERNDTILALAGGAFKREAIQVNTYEPFTWASGWKSPIYILTLRYLMVGLIYVVLL